VAGVALISCPGTLGLPSVSLIRAWLLALGFDQHCWHLGLVDTATSMRLNIFGAFLVIFVKKNTF
jgi:hypothetical protein